MTKQRPFRIKGLGLFLALLMLASPVGSSIAFAAPAETGQPAAGPTNSSLQTTGEFPGIELDGDELVDAGDGVSIWDRAILPLRADDDAAAHSSPNAEAKVRVEEEGIERSLNKPTLSVYNTGTAIDLTFLPKRADAIPDDFHGGEVQLIAARIDGDQELPRSQGELIDLATDNDAATFEMVDETTIDIDTFELGGADVEGDTFTFTPDEPGQYVLLLATPDGDDTGFSVEDGELSRSGDVTIIGMDAVTVQEDPSDVDAPNTVTRGNNVTFDVDTPGAADDSLVNHTIVLYDEKTFTETSTTFTFETVSADADVSVSTDIKSINGDVYLINDPSVLNRDVSNSELAPPVSTTSVANAILADRGDLTVTDDAVQLDASMTAERTTPNAKIDVGTAENWSAGRYHWIHIATTADGSVVGSNSGNLTVNNAGGGGNDGRSGRSNNGQGSPPVSIEERTENGRTTFVIQNAAANKTIRVSPGTSGSGPANPTLTDLDVSFTKDTDAELGVNGDRGATPPVNPNADLGYFNITHEVPDDDIGGVTFSFTVDADRLSDRGVTPEDIMLYRYHDGEWTALETRHLGTADGVHQFEADSPGLSVFAVSTRNAQTATFEVSEASLDTDSVEVGDSVEVTATVENTGGSEGTYTAELLVDGETVDQQDVTVPAGESEPVSFTHTFDEAGSYDVTIGDTAAGTVEVTAADTPTDTATATETPVPFLGGGSSAIIVLVLLVFAGAVALLYRSGRLDDLK
ncbi:PGF-pre-PGF domain-containing protein [Halorarum halophilum]|uniref:PGF-pre-PGF domain-containing protein n=1 Tax=Halorarum halophilum TaxID=2743090 RepID=A0A7D5KM29_9EURY|nr:PGF-pre-PGF domain-containing protein [Halobaculum halophilum]QLG27362.1 PGF-pre-PGF domain-containing protein [Halobaculum halophilum]